MRRLSLAVILLSFMTAAAGCGRDIKEESTKKENTTVITTETEIGEETTASASTTESTTVTEPTTVNYNDNYAGLAGYWYIDGDPSASSFHITKDGKFTSYYADGVLENRGYVRRMLDTELNNFIYLMYLDEGELYHAFADDGEEYKSDIYMGNGGTPHYVKLYGEGGLGDDGRAPEEVYEGTWGCGRATLRIEYKGEGIFHALITWSSSAASYAEWDYPLIFVEDRLICDGNGTKTGVEYEDAESEPIRTVEYTDGSAEFTLEGNSIYWNDKKEHSGDDMLFRK